jgi:hypothetical protein
VKRLKTFLLSLALMLGAVAAALAQSAPFHVLSTASTNATSVWVGQSVLRDVVAVNTTATIYYLKVYDKASPPTVGTDVPKLTFPIPALATAGPPIQLGSTVGLLFVNGVAIAITGGIADTDATNAAAGVAVNLGVAVR